MLRRPLHRFVIAALLPAVSLAGCSTIAPESSTRAQPTSTTQQIKVVTTFLPMYLFTKAVAGNAAQVEILVKPGTEVHEYQSKPADVKTIAEADVVVKNGLGIDEFLNDTIKGAENQRLRVINASQGIQPINGASVVTIGAQEHERAGETAEAGNPHVWLDPVLAQQEVATIRDGLIAADPANQATYQANAAAYSQQLAHTNDQFEQTLKGYRDRTFVTFHDAFSYLAKRYSLKQMAVVAIPEDQLSPADVQKTIATVKQYQVKALLSEPGIDNKLLTTLSQDLKVTVHSLDSLESGELDPKYYFTAMDKNLQTLKKAFQ